MIRSYSGMYGIPATQINVKDRGLDGTYIKLLVSWLARPRCTTKRYIWKEMSLIGTNSASFTSPEDGGFLVVRFTLLESP
jgi:hypothetical protein